MERCWLGRQPNSHIHIHILESEGKCEGMSPHTPRWIPTLGIGVLMDFQIFKEFFKGSKPIRLKTSLYHWKDFKMNMSKMSLHDPFEYLKQKLWPKERPRVKMSI
jgi:hypothetical protein